jgi:hypothetical protein
LARARPDIGGPIWPHLTYSQPPPTSPWENDGFSAKQSTTARSGPLAPIRGKPDAAASTRRWNSPTSYSRRTGPSLGWMWACRAVPGTSTTIVSRCFHCRTRDANSNTRSVVVVKSSRRIYATIRPSPSTRTTGPSSGPGSSTRVIPTSIGDS